MADPHHTTDAADHDAEAYQHGTMPIAEQAKTWAMVKTMLEWGSLSIASILLFLVMWFQPNGSFFAGLIAAVVVFAAGFAFLKAGSKGH